MRYSLILILLLAACATDPSTPPLALAVNRIDVLGGNAQTDTVNQQLPDPILVRVLDTTAAVNGASFAAPAPIAGQIINFVVTSGGGHVFAGAAVTDSLGRAQERWTLGTSAGPQTLEARAVDPESGEPIVYAVITATAVPGPAAHLTLDSTPQLLLLDSAWAWRSRVVAVADGFGNPLPTSVADAADGGLNVTSDAAVANAEGSGALLVTAGSAAGTIPWVARREVRQVWQIAYGCSSPKIVLTGDAGDTVVQADFAGTATISTGAPYAGGSPQWTITIATTVTRWLKNGGTEQAASGDNGTVTQYVDSLRFSMNGGQTLVADSTGYSGGELCGTFWNTATPVTLTP